MEQSCRRKNKENKMPKSKPTENNTAKKVSDLLGKAEGFMEAFNFEEAGKACDKALKLNPNNCEALEMRASAAIEMMQYEVALVCLDKSISIAPFSDHRKYLSRAQLSTGEESLHFYNKGIDIIKIEMTKYISVKPKASESMDVDDETESSGAASEEEIKLKELTHELSTIYCNIAELYTTDLCDADDAEEFCKAAILNAIETEPENPEAYVMKARYEIIIGDKEAALASILRSTIQWFPKISADDTTTNTSDLPTASVRHNTAKVLIELEQHGEASVVIETLLQEDNEDVELWYLMGWNSFLEGESSYDTAKECLVKARKVNHWFPCEDEELLGHIDELLTKLGISPADIDFEAVSDDDDQYEDIEDDEQIENEIIELAEKENSEN